MWIFIALTMIAISFSACERFYQHFDIQPDNPTEEFVEDLIKQESGIELDLTPETLENKEK